ncbi:MAG: ABC transporter [Nitrospirae bacterium GWC2_46_6]|nr:MAG: ABC transporter [Nitrospirae bacterium GWC2_46_6]OGW20102.1 MAG: ABC transporter [Nitrospirae bacterium GWA2_46_11]OGW23749.1 MAG: ABC transporter [Nitrospirae bacterium GWB2_47_37]
MIELRDVLKTYKTGGQPIKAVDNVSFQAAKGEFVAIMGHSGSGKTTLLNLMGGLARPDSGSVVIDGIDLISISDSVLSEFRNKKMSFIFQFASLIPTLTSVENIMLPSVFSRESGSNLRAAACELLEMVGLADKMNSYPSQLSGGQQRRVAIARAFINNPEIIFADEPTGDLDEDAEAEIIKLFKTMNKEKGITFIMVTHSSSIANEAGRVMRMHNGRLGNA